MIRGIFFDLGLTLVYTPIAEDTVKILKEMGHDIELEPVKKAYYLADQYFFTYYPGIMNRQIDSFFPWYMDVFARFLGADIHVPALTAEVMHRFPPRSRWVPYEDVMETVTALKAQGYVLGIISNWDNTARSVLDTVGLTDYMDHIIISAEVGCHKPLMSIFEIALYRSGLKAEETLFVGDNYTDDIVAASKIGIHAVLINRYPEWNREKFNCPQIRSLKELSGHVAKLIQSA
ncbi:MAG: HAD-IA family hydrolase [Bacillota bacterium]